MKNSLIAAVAIACTLAACNKADITTPKGKASYAIGYSIGRNMKNQGIEIDVKTMATALAEVLNGSKPQLSDVEMQLALQDMSVLRSGAAPAANPEALAKNKEYLEANKAKPGVTVTPSGLQYKVINAGNGPSPKISNTVKVHYRGTLIDGTEFDSSYKRGQPAEFGVGGVIRGWTEALQLMKKGAKYQLTIPSELAYGERGSGGSVPPNSVLNFEVELIDFK